MGVEEGEGFRIGGEGVGMRKIRGEYGNMEFIRIEGEVEGVS